MGLLNGTIMVLHGTKMGTCVGLHLNHHLVGGLEHDLYFSIQLGLIIPTDELIFFTGVETTK